MSMYINLGNSQSLSHINKHEIKKRLGSVLLTSTPVLDIQGNRIDFSAPLQQINEIRLLVLEPLGKRIVKFVVALIFVLCPLAITTYLLLYSTDYLKKLFQSDYLILWIIPLAAITIFAGGVSLLRDFTNNKKYIKVELHTANTRRMLYFSRKQISQQQVNSLLQDIKAAVNDLSSSNH